MSGIQARSTLGKLEDNINNGKDLRKEQFITGQPIGSGRRALDTIPMGVYLVGNDVIEAGSDNNLVVLTANLAKKGDILRINTSANSIEEFEVAIDDIISVNSFRLGAVLSASLEAGDTVSILRPVTQRMSSSGATLTTLTPSAIAFNKDSVLTEVTEDTGTPSNTVPLPVKLVGAGGDINITAGDLNVQLSHLGVNADITRIGDGVTELGITLSNEAKTHDASAITLLTNLLTELQLKADLSETQPVSAASLPLPSGASTSANQTTGNTSLATIAGKDFATQATLAALLVELQLKADLSETQPVSVASLPLPSGAATAANQTTANTTLSTIAGKDFATQTTLALMKTALDSLLTGEGAVADAAVSNPASSGSMIALLKGILTLLVSTNTKLDSLETNTSPNLDSMTNVTATTNTLSSMPANARYMIIQNSTEALSALRWTPSTVTPLVTVGSFLGPGQATPTLPAGSIRTLSFDGSAIDCCITWFV